MIEKIKEDLYINKTKFGYRIVYPILRDKDKGFVKGNINWKNLLIQDWGRLITVIFFLALLMFGVWAYKQDMEQCFEIVENPCDYCAYAVEPEGYGLGKIPDVIFDEEEILNEEEI